MREAGVIAFIKKLKFSPIHVKLKSKKYRLT